MKNVDLLEWDSTFFEFPIAQIKPERITAEDMGGVLDFCEANKVALLQFKCDSHDRRSILTAEANGFHFADTRVILEKYLDDCTDDTPLPDEIGFRMAIQDDIPELMDIAEHIYVHSRYHFDTNFPREKVRVFYQDWVRKAVLGQFDDLAWILCKGQTPIAFCTAKLDKPKAIIGLVGLHPAFSGHRLGQIVVSKSLEWLCKNQINHVTVVTQGRNYPALRLYQKIGFTITKSQIYYHCWFDSSK